MFILTCARLQLSFISFGLSATKCIRDVSDFGLLRKQFARRGCGVNRSDCSAIVDGACITVVMPACTRPFEEQNFKFGATLDDDCVGEFRGMTRRFVRHYASTVITATINPTSFPRLRASEIGQPEIAGLQFRNGNGIISRRRDPLSQLIDSPCS